MPASVDEQTSNTNRRVLGGPSSGSSADVSSTNIGTKKHPVRSGLNNLFNGIFDRLFGFRNTPVTVLILLVYVTVIYLVTSIESGLAPPLVLQQLNDCERDILEQSWMDLQVITKSAHPYNSYANDEVHDYILSTAQKITKDVPHAVIDAEPQVLFYRDGSTASYYESNNILVRIPGKNSTTDNLGSILLTAHFDSVPTGYGATDAGMGVVSLLGLLRYFSQQENAPERTVIFNFNNNEEFGLLGARAFTYHPWWNDVDVFLNLEGAGSGGKAILLQGSDYEITKHYMAVRNPSATSLVEQGWAGGFVKSLTDYTVYTAAGVRGMDIAFYKPRTWYHTKRDSIQGANRDSLAHMFTSALDVSVSLTQAPHFESSVKPFITLPSWMPVLPIWKGGNNNDGDDDNEKASFEPAVFTDFLGFKFLVFPLSVFIALNLMILFSGPLLVFVLFSAVVKRLLWTDRGFKRSVMSLVFGITGVVGVIHMIVFYNPFVIVAHFVRPFLAYVFAFILLAGLTLRFAASHWPVLDQKLGVFMVLHNISWLILAYCTLRLFWNQNNGLYVATELYTGNCVAVIIGLFGHLLFGRKQANDEESSHDEHSDGEEDYSTSEAEDEDEGNAEADGPSEETPLLPSTKPRTRQKPQDTSYDWILQFVAVSGLVYVVYYQFYQVVDALHEGLVDSVDGLRPVHAITAIYACIMGSIVLPFIHRTNKVVWFILTVGTAWLTCSCMMLRPFSESTPYKVRFHQQLHVSGDIIDRSFISARAIEVEDYLVPVLQDLPSVKLNDTLISCKDTGYGYDICDYKAELPKKPQANWFNLSATSDHGSVVSSPSALNTADLTIQLEQNRLCKLLFDDGRYGDTSPLRYLEINGQFGLNHSRGVTQLELRKLGWSSDFQVHVEWAPHWSETDGFIQDLHIQVQCFWNPYKPGHEMIDVPAMNEAMDYSPSWVLWSNSQPSLVMMTQEIVV